MKSGNPLSNSMKGGRSPREMRRKKLYEPKASAPAHISMAICPMAGMTFVIAPIGRNTSMKSAVLPDCPDKLCLALARSSDLDTMIVQNPPLLFCFSKMQPAAAGEM